ncbi:hypothetical protein DH2020_012291 [Rehmannia glutinosa]|uniref:RING-type E3 ubiquitin transferase n=1 Tax=Rehmannia glutinosa TaxID=99300 RepID=A0ABR0X210_REHGL
MTEVPNLHRPPPPPPPPPMQPFSNPSSGLLQEEPELQEEEFYVQPKPFDDFDSFSPPNNLSSSSLIDDHTTPFNFWFDLDEEPQNPGSEYEDPSSIFYMEENDEQMNFVSDLFECRETLLTEDPIWEFNPDQADGSGSYSSIGSELESNLRLRVVRIDTDSDSEEFEVNSGFINNDNDNYDGFVINNNIHYGENERVEFEWEEVTESIFFDERENLNSVIDRIEEITVSSDITSELGYEEEEEERNLEWEVLLAADNLNRNFEFEYSEEINNDGSEFSRINLPEDYMSTLEYDTLFGQLIENENALKGSPPAAKSVVDNLPCVVLTKEENNSEFVCAICKDEFAVGEKMTKMPCCHLYHGECILGWLRIRNTCPVCRYELPTDDADYEKRRNERVSNGVGAELRYNFELLP